MPKNLMLLLLVTTSLLACNHDDIDLQASPGEVACSGETVTLTWQRGEGDVATGNIRISADRHVDGLPVDLGTDVDTLEVTINETTKFTASKGSKRTDVTVFVPTHTHHPLSFPNPQNNMNVVCNPGSLPFWRLNVGNDQVSGEALARDVVNHSDTRLLVRHEGVSTEIGPNSSSGGFEGMAITGTWDFEPVGIILGRCPPRSETSGGTAPTPPGISIAIEAKCR